MKKTISLVIAAVLLQISMNSFAQTNIFPANGNTGIGTTTPAYKLTVQTPLATNGIIHTDGTIRVGTYLNAGAGYIGTASNHPLCFRTNNSSAQAILLQNGNFGIGTTSPTERLTVRTLSGLPGIVHTDGVVKIGSMVNSTGGLFGTLSNHPLFFRTNNGTAQVTLLQNGRVGIGTTTPQAQLDVTKDILVNGLTIGRGGGNVAGNTALGENALVNNLDYFIDNDAGGEVYIGNNNTALGRSALSSNTEGDDNVAVGSSALSSSQYGLANTAVGTFALASLSSRAGLNTAVGAYAMESSASSYNTAVGASSMSGNMTGNNNTCMGFESMGSDSWGLVKVGSNNTGIGSSSLQFHRIGDGNSALGVNSLSNDSSGTFNTAVGFEAMLRNKSGFQNTAVGTKSLDGLTTGFDNVAVGYRSTDSSTSAYRNTAIGSYSLFRNKTAIQNAALGFYALYNATSGYNVAAGAYGLINTTTGSGNTSLGYYATPNSGVFSNTTTIGYFALTTASNQVRIGNNSITSIGGFANWSNVSDGRIKKNIKENVPGLAFINKLQPVTYNLSIAEVEKITDAKAAKPADMEKETEEILASRKEKEKIVYSGFIAQDVEKAAASLNYDFSGVDAAKNEKDLYGLRYAEFVVPLVKAVQELSAKNDNLQKEVEALKALMENKDNKTNVQLSSSSLEQNVPNPFSEFTTINYTLPLKTVKAAIVVTDKNGKKIKEINLGGSGKGVVTVNTISLNTGVYQYSLYVGGILMDTKQMIVSRQ